MAVSEFPSSGLLLSQTHKEMGRELSGCVVLPRNNHRHEVLPSGPLDSIPAEGSLSPQ